MKKATKLITATLILLMPLFALAQNPPHPNGGSAPGSGNTPVGGGAPLGSGLIISISLAAAYSFRKHKRQNTNSL